jgi:hypothetical protein
MTPAGPMALFRANCAGVELLIFTYRIRDWMSCQAKWGSHLNKSGLISCLKLDYRL